MDPLLTDVRLYIYNQLIATAVAPEVAETAAALGQGVEDVDRAYRTLAEQKALVLRPGTSTVWMAMPFSNMQTPFTVICEGRAYYANCAWDAFGIPAVRERDAQIVTTCADCGDTLQRKVASGRLTDARGVVHFALPVRRWWEDVGLT